MGRETTVLWVKGSGSDIADISEKGFAGLKLDEVLPLFERASMSDEEMIAYLDRTAFETGQASFLELVDAERALRTAELGERQAEAAVSRRHAELARAVGDAPAIEESKR